MSHFAVLCCFYYLRGFKRHRKRQESIESKDAIGKTKTTDWVRNKNKQESKPKSQRTLREKEKVNNMFEHVHLFPSHMGVTFNRVALNLYLDMEKAGRYC